MIVSTHRSGKSFPALSNSSFPYDCREHHREPISGANFGGPQTQQHASSMATNAHPELRLVRFFAIRRLHPPVAGPDVLGRAARRHDWNYEVLLRARDRRRMGILVHAALARRSDGCERQRTLLGGSWVARVRDATEVNGSWLLLPGTCQRVPCSRRNESTVSQTQAQRWERKEIGVPDLMDEGRRR